MVLLALGALLGTGLSGVVKAHVGDVASGVIHSCINNGSGTIRVIDPLDTCNANDMAVDWNAVGPQGPEGPQGPQGEQGL